MNTNKIVNNEKIREFLLNYFAIEGIYTISDEGIINVDGDITLDSNKFNADSLTELPIQFGHVKGYFCFENSTITNLKGFPYTVGEYCSVNDSYNLTTLENSPQCQKIFSSACDKIESLSKKYTAESSVLSKKCTDGIITLDGLNCNEFIENDWHGSYLNLKRFGTNFTANSFEFSAWSNLPIPTTLKKHTEEFSMLDEIMYLNNKKLLFKYISTMRHFIKLNATIKSEQGYPWIDLLNDYSNHKDCFRLAQEFEALFNEPLLKIDSKENIESFFNTLEPIEIKI